MGIHRRAVQVQQVVLRNLLFVQPASVGCAHTLGAHHRVALGHLGQQLLVAGQRQAGHLGQIQLQVIQAAGGQLRFLLALVAPDEVGHLVAQMLLGVRPAFILAVKRLVHPRLVINTT